MEGTCACIPGYINTTECVNMNGRDCFDSLEAIFYGQMGCLAGTFAISEALRLARKIYRETKEKNRKLKNLHQKPPLLIALHIINVSLAGLIYSSVKWM